MLRKGERLTIHYPKSNTITKKIKLTNCPPRRIEVLRVRDLLRAPITLHDFVRRPFVQRSRYLVTAIDRDRKEKRKYYLGASLEFRSPQSLYVGVYSDQRLVRLIGREFRPTVVERQTMLACVDRWLSMIDEDETLGIVAADLRIASGREKNGNTV